DPPLSGPAAALAAGVAALGGGSGRGGACAGGASVPGADVARAGDALVLCLAADMPAPREGVEALLAAAAEPPAGSDSAPDASHGATHHASPDPAPDGWIAVADGRDQPLLTLLRLDAARAAFAGVTGGSVMRVLRGLDLRRVPVPASAAADVDTWEDARAHGVGAPPATPETPAPATPETPAPAAAETPAPAHTPVDWAEARRRVTATAEAMVRRRRRAASSLPPETGTVPVADVHSPVDVPHYTSSAMDGYAVAGPPPWRVLAAPAAGAQGRNIHRTGGDLHPGEALPVLTGSLLPRGAEAVVRSEHVTLDGTTLTPDSGRPPRPGADIRHAGEELAAGEVLVRAGTTLSARHLALLSTCGVDAVEALAPPTVALAFTGNEVVTTGLPGPGEVRDAFSRSFPALLTGWGARVTSTVRLPDDPDAVAAWFTDPATRAADVVVVTGGSGHSGQDFARQVITAGADAVLADSVRCAPGHPTLLTTRRVGGAAAGGADRDGGSGADRDTDGDAAGDADGPRTQIVVGAPGNPLAAHVALHSFVEPALSVLRGGAAPGPAPGISAVDLPADRRGRVRLTPAAYVGAASGAAPDGGTADDATVDADGTNGGTAGATGVRLAPVTRTHSHMLSGYATADVLLVTPPEGVPAGGPVRYLPL
ncbi:molybdopterin molybdotransferase MoeA, partial [Corynebacterium bovis]